MKNKYLIVIIFSFLLIPSVAFASWWNPLSWFKKNTKSIGQINPIQVQQNNSPIIKNKQTPAEIKISEKKIIPKKASTSTNKIPVPEVTTTTSPVFDVCKNIEGIQTRTPDGMRADNGICLSSNSNTEQQISQIQNSLNQIVVNTTPPPKPIVPAAIIPEVKEISNEEMGVWQVYEWSGETLWIATAESQKGDVVTLKINNQEYTKTVDNLSGKHSIWSGFSFVLNPQEQYPATLKLQRGNTFTIMNFTVNPPLMPQ